MQINKRTYWVFIFLPLEYGAYWLLSRLCVSFYVEQFDPRGVAFGLGLEYLKWAVGAYLILLLIFRLVTRNQLLILGGSLVLLSLLMAILGSDREMQNMAYFGPICLVSMASLVIWRFLKP